VAGRIVVMGDLPERYEVERLLNERHPELHVETVGLPWEMVERATGGPFDLALVLKGPIAAHQQRMDTIASLRRNGFTGKVLFAGAFLTEKQDAVRAGADYAFDPDKQVAEQVVAAALYRPLVAADHPYLRYLFVGEWAETVGYRHELPREAPDLLVSATSCHETAAFYSALAAYAREHPQTRCIVVEDDGGEEARTEALATGIQPYVVLAQEGLGKVTSLGLGFLREQWLARVSAA
jgi:DNA-binding NarL/FixJ family response regulator